MISRNRQWSNLSRTQRTATVLMGVVQVALLVGALIDLRQRTAEEINGSKRMWMGLVFINYIGPIAYFLFGRKR